MANEQAQAFIDQATQSLQGGQFQQALELADQAIALEGSNSDSYVLRGICLSQLSQPDAAIEAFRQAITLSPYNAKAYYNLAVHYNSLGRKIEALEMAREAAAVDTRHQGARQLVAQLDAELAGPPASPTGVRDSGNMQDPLAQAPPPSTTASRPESPTVPGQMSPPSVAPAGAYSPNPATFHSGYDTPAHSLPWVEKMGPAWTLIGWALSVLSLLLFGFLIMAYMKALNGVSFSDSAAVQAAAKQVQQNVGAVGYLGWIVTIFMILWTLFDIMDRRGAWLWIVPQILCSCCGFGWLILPLYMLTGRK